MSGNGTGQPPERSNFDHYVAQHFLKLFLNERGVAYVGDFITKSVRPYSEFSGILGRPNWSVDQAIEDNFTAVETKVAQAMRTLAADPKTIGGFAPNTLMALRDYICLHYARSVGVHDALNQATEQFASELNRTAPPGFDTKTLGLRDATRPESLLFGMRVADHVDTALRMKGCVAIRAPGQHQFVVGDNPLVNLTSRDTYLYKGGLPNRDTYLWFPLNPNLGLLFVYQLGNVLGDGKVKLVDSDDRLTQTLNRAEAYLATQYVVGRSHGVVKSLIRRPNVGPARSKVTALDWAPFVIHENKATYDIEEALIDALRTRA